MPTRDSVSGRERDASMRRSHSLTAGVLLSDPDPRRRLGSDSLRPANAAIVEVALDAGELDRVEVGREIEVARRDERAGLAMEDVWVGPRSQPGTPARARGRGEPRGHRR